MRWSLKSATVAVGAAGIVAAAFVGGRAWASGIPAAGALTYSGLLQDATGNPLTGTGHNLEIKFWPDATAAATICDTGSPTPLALNNGRFSVVLPLACTAAIGTNAHAYVELLLDGSHRLAAGRRSARCRTRSRANHAVSADSATSVTGPQAQQIVPPGAGRVFQCRRLPCRLDCARGCARSIRCRPGRERHTCGYSRKRPRRSGEPPSRPAWTWRQRSRPQSRRGNW